MIYKNKSIRRRVRNRARLQQRSSGRPRLSVHRSVKHIYAQVIDDKHGNTLCAASSLDKTLRADLNSGGGLSAASKVGSLIAERAKALAEGAREGGLAF